MSRALIIGGGIGGLCAAIALRQAGIDVTVFERVTEMHEVGAGFAEAGIDRCAESNRDTLHACYHLLVARYNPG